MVPSDFPYIPMQVQAELYKTEIVPLASILTPNQFECEKLTGIQVITYLTLAVVTQYAWEVTSCSTSY